MGWLTQLSQLYLDLNQLTGTIPTEIGWLTQLSDLGLSNNQLSGTIPSTFGNLGRLSYLGLHDNKLTGIIPSTLGNMMQLTYLILFNNTNLTGTIPSSLCSIYGITINIDCPNFSCTCCTNGTTYSSCNSTWTNWHYVRSQNIKMCCSNVYRLLKMGETGFIDQYYILWLSTRLVQSECSVSIQRNRKISHSLIYLISNFTWVLFCGIYSTSIHLSSWMTTKPSHWNCTHRTIHLCNKVETLKYNSTSTQYYRYQSFIMLVRGSLCHM